MAQANTITSISDPSSRRRFLMVSAAASVASVGTLAAAAMPATQACAVSDPVFDLIASHKKIMGTGTASRPRFVGRLKSTSTPPRPRWNRASLSSKTRLSLTCLSR